MSNRAHESILFDSPHLVHVVVLGQQVGTVDFDDTRQHEYSVPKPTTHPGHFASYTFCQTQLVDLDVQ